MNYSWPYSGNDDEEIPPCRCNHSIESHIGTPSKSLSQINGLDYCWFYNECRCKQYTPDNLKFLERKYEQSKLAL
jgi:hypothetical protein